MPTQLKRHQVTELPAVKHALDVAQAAWPDVSSRTKLLYRLVQAGAEHLQEDPSVAGACRARLSRELAGGVLFDAPAGYLEALREEWDK